MTERDTVPRYDEEVITIGFAEVQSAVPSTNVQALPQEPLECYESAKALEPSDLIAPEGIKATEVPDTNTATEATPAGLPAPFARKVVLALALFGVFLIVAYVLDYWGVIQLPF